MNEMIQRIISKVERREHEQTAGLAYAAPPLNFSFHAAT
jgi:hypothetical protein